MDSLQTEAIIIRRINYGEADRILTLLTPNNGKLSAIARGVRKAKSKLAGSLELFATSHLIINRAQVGSMGTVITARLIHFYGGILSEYERTALAYELMKQVNRVAETISEPEFYYLLRDAFGFLEQSTIDIRLTELWFRLRLAGLLGHALNLVTDIHGKRLASDLQYGFSTQEMAFLPQSSGQFSADHIKLLRLASIKDPATIKQVGGIATVLDTCLWLARLIET